MEPVPALRPHGARSVSSSISIRKRPTLLHHPMLRNLSCDVSRLEQSAEELSAGGSDIGEEIRRMDNEQKERSRQNSIQSSHQDEAGHDDDDEQGRRTRSVGRRLQSDGSRASSTHGYSIVDVNGAARGGGYSPGGFITSPVESIRSGSWSHASMPRKASTTASSRLAQMAEPMQEGRPLDSALAPSDTTHTPSATTSSHGSHASQSSFARRYDQIANDIEQSLFHVPASPTKHSSSMFIPMPDHGQPSEDVTPPARPHSADTFQEAQLVFKDFDGVHYAPGDEFVELDEHGNEIRRVSARGSSGAFSIDAASMLPTPRTHPMSLAAPPPGKDMVYYPAPVPRMLNLPKRLSRLPAASVQNQWRTQVLGQLSAEARGSAPWLPQSRSSESGRSRRSGSESNGDNQPGPRGMLNERMSIANFNNLPPQLRASVFFDHQTVVQDVEVKQGSAVATFDNILAASATAPVSAFTDHPFAGDVRKEVYMPERLAPRQSTTRVATEDLDTSTTPRRSMMGKLLRRMSSGNDLEAAAQKGGGGRRLSKRKSQMSLAAGFDRQSQVIHDPEDQTAESNMSEGLISQVQNTGLKEGQDEESSRRRSRHLNNNEQIEEDFKDAEAGENVNEADPIFAQPTTLLAELQVRKLQQKSRNRTAATAFPNGMHSTLLQMDAVEEINKRYRQRHKVALAWEDPTLEQAGDADDEVPLGMLYPARDGLVTRKVGDDKDWDRPLGLAAKRELEDNEPLSSRRNRLHGLPPNHGRSAATHASVSSLHLAGQPGAPPEHEEDDGEPSETLGQRMRRVKTKDALDTAISDLAPKDGTRPNSTFTDDVMSQFGGLDVKEQDAVDVVKVTPNDTAPEPENETLGQRRTRLQRERAAAGETALHPSNKSRNSLADALATDPAGTHNIPGKRNTQPPEGTLLHASDQAQTRQKRALLNTNIRSSTYGLDRPLVDARPQLMGRTTSSGLLGQSYGQSALAGGYAGGMYNNGAGTTGIQAAARASSMYLGPGTNGYFASPTMGMQYGPNGNSAMMGYPAQQQPLQQPGFNPRVYQGFGVTPMTMPMSGAYMFPQQQQPQQQSQQTTRPVTYGAAAMGMNGIMSAGFGQEDLSLGPRQRAQIDQWRMSVAP